MRPELPALAPIAIACGLALLSGATLAQNALSVDPDPGVGTVPLRVLDARVRVGGERVRLPAGERHGPGGPHRAVQRGRRVVGGPGCLWRGHGQARRPVRAGLRGRLVASFQRLAGAGRRPVPGRRRWCRGAGGRRPDAASARRPGVPLSRRLYRPHLLEGVVHQRADQLQPVRLDDQCRFLVPLSPGRLHRHRHRRQRHRPRLRPRRRDGDLRQAARFGEHGRRAAHPAHRPGGPARRAQRRRTALRGHRDRGCRQRRSGRLRRGAGHRGPALARGEGPPEPGRARLGGPGRRRRHRHRRRPPGEGRRRRHAAPHRHAGHRRRAGRGGRAARPLQGGHRGGVAQLVARRAGRRSRQLVEHAAGRAHPRGIRRPAWSATAPRAGTAARGRSRPWCCR